MGYGSENIGVGHFQPYLAVRDNERERSHRIQRVTEAHNTTTWFSSDHVQSILKKKEIDYEELTSLCRYFRAMPREHRWVNVSQKLAITFHMIISFAEMIPGFGSLIQNDRFALLSAGCFGVALLRMIPYVDSDRSAVLYGDTLIPECVIPYLSDDAGDNEFVLDAFNSIKRLAEFRFTNAELALYSALVLLSPSERSGVEEIVEVGKLQDGVASALRAELQKRPTGAVSVYNALVLEIPTLRNLGRQHASIFKEIKEMSPDVQFPVLYADLFLAD